MWDTGWVFYTPINTNLCDNPTKWVLLIPILQIRKFKFSLSNYGPTDNENKVRIHTQLCLIPKPILFPKTLVIEYVGNL